LLASSFQKLRDEEGDNSAIFIEHNPYCIDKILDHFATHVHGPTSIRSAQASSDSRTREGALQT
jgi:hypothetical protein